MIKSRWKRQITRYPWKVGLVHWQKVGLELWQKVGLVRWQKVGLVHWQKVGLELWQTVGFVHWQKVGLELWQKMGLVHWQKVGLVHWQEVGLLHWQKFGLVHWQKVGLAKSLIHLLKAWNQASHHIKSILSNKRINYVWPRSADAGWTRSNIIHYSVVWQNGFYAMTCEVKCT